MNKSEKNNETASLKNRLIPKGKVKDVIIVGVLALTLVFAAWKIFYADDETETFSQGAGSETEQRVSRLLQEMDGVGNAEVMICETEEGVQSVVVVCEGARDFSIVMDVREAVAAALGTEEKAVKVYLKKE